MIKGDGIAVGIGKSATITVSGSVVSTDTVSASYNGTTRDGVWETDHFIIKNISAYGTWTVTVNQTTRSVAVDAATNYTITI